MYIDIDDGTAEGIKKRNEENLRRWKKQEAYKGYKSEESNPMTNTTPQEALDVDELKANVVNHVYRGGMSARTQGKSWTIQCLRTAINYVAQHYHLTPKEKNLCDQ